MDLRDERGVRDLGWGLERLERLGGATSLTSFTSIKSTSYCASQQGLVPSHSGQFGQLQNALPALRPFFASRLRIGEPHFGQRGASS